MVRGLPPRQKLINSQLNSYKSTSNKLEFEFLPDISDRFYYITEKHYLRSFFLKAIGAPLLSYWIQYNAKGIYL